MNPLAWARRKLDEIAYRKAIEEVSELFTARRAAEAEQACTRALALAEAAYGPTHAEVVTPLYVLASIRLEDGRLDEALAATERALTIAEENPGATEPPLPRMLEQLAAIWERQGKAHEVEALLRRMLASYERMRAPDPGEVAATLNRLGLLLGRKGQREEAAPLFERAIALREEAFGADHLLVAESLYNAASFRCEESVAAREEGAGAETADVFRAAGLATPALSRAEAMLKRALSIAEAKGDEGAALRASILHNLGVLCEEAGRGAEAVSRYEASIALREEIAGKDDAALRPTLVRLARLHDAAGRFDRARPLYERALALAERDLGPSHRITGAIRAWLGARQ